MPKRINNHLSKHQESFSELHSYRNEEARNFDLLLALKSEGFILGGSPVFLIYPSLRLSFEGQSERSETPITNLFIV